MAAKTIQGPPWVDQVKIKIKSYGASVDSTGFKISHHRKCKADSPDILISTCRRHQYCVYGVRMISYPCWVLRLHGRIHGRVTRKFLLTKEKVFTDAGKKIQPRNFIPTGGVTCHKSKWDFWVVLTS